MNRNNDQIPELILECDDMYLIACGPPGVVRKIYEMAYDRHASERYRYLVVEDELFSTLRKIRYQKNIYDMIKSVQKIYKPSAVIVYNAIYGGDVLDLPVVSGKNAAAENDLSDTEWGRMTRLADGMVVGVYYAFPDNMECGMTKADIVTMMFSIPYAKKKCAKSGFQLPPLDLSEEDMEAAEQNDAELSEETRMKIEAALDNTSKEAKRIALIGQPVRTIQIQKYLRERQPLSKVRRFTYLPSEKLRAWYRSNVDPAFQTGNVIFGDVDELRLLLNGAKTVFGDSIYRKALGEMRGCRWVDFPDPLVFNRSANIVHH